MAKENEDGSEKTEQPTLKRISKARQDGNVAKSQDVNVVAGLFVGLIYLLLMGHTMAKSLALLLKKIISQQALMEASAALAQAQGAAAGEAGPEGEPAAEGCPAAVGQRPDC